MDSALIDLISRYVSVAEDLFPRLAAHVGVQLPISNKDWACLGIEQRGETADGVKYFKHGFGVAMKDSSQSIELDLGAEGQFDGFDAWRLHDFAERNDIVIPYTDHRSLKAAMERAADAGQLRYSEDGLYYRANEI